MLLRIALIAVISEKIYEHAGEALAFALNLGRVRSDVTTDPNVLMISEAVVGVLFILALWGVLRNLRWTPSLLIGLALFDIFGDFASGAAGGFSLSFLVASLLLILALSYRRLLMAPKA